MGKFHDKAMNGFQGYAKMLINPVYAMQKYGEWAGKASAGGEKVAKNLFDVEGTNKRRQVAISRLGESVKGFKIEAKAPIVTMPKMDTPLIAGGKTDTTSMLSAGDLFSMMQTGSDSKATMVSEQQKTNEKLDELIDLTGGVE